jgi:hypothetical protein
MYFNTKEIYTLEDLKKQYRRLAMSFHPDLGGKLETMQEINAEYDRLFPSYKNKHVSFSGEAYEKETTEVSSDFINIINALIKLAREKSITDFRIELCGTWLWIHGQTIPVKEELKKLGCEWASQKRLWYWRAEKNRSFNHKPVPMEKIRAAYGSEFISRNPNPEITG